MYRLLAALLLPLFLAGCAQPQPEQTSAAPVTAVTTLSPQAFLARYASDAIVLDVRTPGEYQSGHLAVARNIDFLADDFQARVDPLPREATYYLYCRSGNRSGQAARLMANMGFTNVYNIGGYNSLAQAGAQVVE